MHYTDLPNKQCIWKNYFIFSTATGSFPVHDSSKPPGGISYQIVGGIMAFIMSIITMVRLTRNMPRRLTEAALYSGSVYYDGNMIKGHQLSPAISSNQHMSMMKRMAELEDKVNILSNKPAVMPPDKEEMLNAALSRVDALEQELSSTKKVYMYCLIFLNLEFFQ